MKLPWHMRPLSSSEMRNLKELTNLGLRYCIFEATPTGLRKSDPDCTLSMRQFFLDVKYHDYQNQERGEKKKKTAYYITAQGLVKTTISLYHPKAKPNKAIGDPRFCLYRMQSQASAYHKFAFIIDAGTLYAINITKYNLAAEINKGSCLATELKKLSASSMAIVNELLDKFTELSSKGWIKGELDADTSSGRTYESLLGIPMNSSKSPDYKGIEIKTARGEDVDSKKKRTTRKGLFTKVPDWDISVFKSSKQIFDRFSYFSEKEQGMRLQCTMSTLGPNSQGLFLKIDKKNPYLVECHTKVGNICAWRLESLYQTLREKHRQTFWVEVDTTHINGEEYFRVRKIEYTRNPDLTQFVPLLESGLITIDHLAKIKKNGTLKESPSFKLKKSALNILLPESTIYHFTYND